MCIFVKVTITLRVADISALVYFLSVNVCVVIVLERAQSYVEMYDLEKDPYQLTNVAASADPNLLIELNKHLVQLSVCSGQSCRNLDSPRPYIRRFVHEVFPDML